MARYKPENRKPGDIELQDLPMFETPFSRVGDHFYTMQSGPCADHELDYIKCAAKVGYRRAEKECKLYYDDWAECAFEMKQTMRYVEMQKVRKEKGLPFAPKPPRDSVVTPNM